MFALFDEAATFTSDGGGRVSAARNVLHGRDRITRFLAGITAKWRGRATERLTVVNGELAVASYLDGRLAAISAFETDGERILAIYRVMNPDKLRHAPG